MNITDIQQRVVAAKQLHIQSQSNAQDKAMLAMASYAGVIEYFPEELVMTVKAGTPITEIEQLLAAQDQGLPFAVLNSDTATIGGAYAVGSPQIRDAVLGVKIIDGQGRILTFGGQVMKNVAGYDVARLLVGSQGKLAVICEISFKVLPQAYIDHSVPKPSTQIADKSSAIIQIEQGLKSIFDPKAVFI